MQYMGQTGVNTTTYEAIREDDCMVCGVIRDKLAFSGAKTFAELIATVTEKHSL